MRRRLAGLDLIETPLIQRVKKEGRWHFFINIDEEIGEKVLFGCHKKSWISCCSC